MEKLKSFVNHYFWLIAAVLFVAMSAIFLISIVGSYKTAKFNKEIEKQNAEANTAIKDAQNNNTNAANFDIDRSQEDVIRAETIQPKLAHLRRQSRNSKLELTRTRKSYNEKKNDTSNLSNSDALNCLELNRLFTNVRFNDCR